MKIGIMGGTFDPIHVGHLTVAGEVKVSHGLDKVLFVPAGNPVFKMDREIAPAEDRYNMCVLGCRDFGFEVSRVEIDRVGVTYTIDTILELGGQYAGAEFFFILGEDAFASFENWRESKRILELCSLIVVPREMDVSSTMVREKLLLGECVDGLIPGAVLEYILEKGLYFCDLKLELGEERFGHSVGAMDEAVKLGARYGLGGAELEKLRTAALLHDCAKIFCDTASFEEICLYCEGFGLEFLDCLEGCLSDGLFKRLPTLAHCYVGAVVARKEYGVDDEEILGAIAHHTFGRAGMTLMEKIVYLVDFFEPTRFEGAFGDYLEALKKARELAYEDIDRAMLFVLGFVIDKNERAGKAVYFKSLEALEFYRLKLSGDCGSGPQ